MADLCVPYTYAGLTINGDADTDTLVFTEADGDGVFGLDGAPVRRQVDNLANEDGGESQPAHFGPRVIRFKGQVNIGSVPGGGAPSTAYLTALNTLEAAVVAALEAQLNSNSTLAWTPTGLTAHSISAKYGMPGGEINFTGNVYKRIFEFSLLAEDPEISVA